MASDEQGSIIISSKDLDDIDQQFRDIVFGYIREQQAEFINDFIIPLLISILTQNYFCTASGRWDKSCVNEGMEISPNGSCVHRTVESSLMTTSMAFGVRCVRENEVKTWRIKITTPPESRCFSSIGICTADHVKTVLTKHAAPEIGQTHCLGWNGKIYGGKDNYENKHYYDGELMTGDEVETICDMIEGTISYKVNDKDLGVAFTGLDKKKLFRFYVGMFTKDNKIEFI